MTLTVSSSHADIESSPDPVNDRATSREGTSEPAIWGWAVVEIRPDGTWGRPQLVRGQGPADAAAAAASSLSEEMRELSPTLRAHLGSLHMAKGELSRAAAVLAKGAAESTWSEARNDCLGALAHVEALRGDLRCADRHARQVRSTTSASAGAGLLHAHLARTWVDLERGEFSRARRRLNVVAKLVQSQPLLDQDLFLTASHLLVESKLLIATGQPEAAVRLFADGGDHVVVGPTGGWLRDLVTIARAEALLAVGEPQRALAIVTPTPRRGIAEAAVVAAAARRSVGDVRGAKAVLSGAVVDLEQAPLTLQIEAWLLDCRLAEDRGERDRARMLMDRALRAAAPEQARRSFVREWRWVRAFLDRDLALGRTHRDFLATVRVEEGGNTRTTTQRHASDPACGCLTERESQVLDLLAQMYSTEEIAAALYVSSNTVKTHLKGIFGKLCVNRRVDAVRRGRQLGLC